MGDEARCSRVAASAPGRTASTHRYSMKLASPSLTVRCAQSRQVTKLPNHWCASCRRKAWDITTTAWPVDAVLVIQASRSRSQSYTPRGR